MQGGFVRRLLLLASFALVASLFLASTAGAQEMMQEKMMDESMMDESMMMEQPKMMDDFMMEKGKMEMPKTGGLATLSMHPDTLVKPLEGASRYRSSRHVASPTARPPSCEPARSPPGGGPCPRPASSGSRLRFARGVRCS